MIYKIFNPLTGQYTTADTLTAAQTIQAQNKQDLANQIPMQISDGSAYALDKPFADNFISTKQNIPLTTDYVHSEFNLTTNQNLGRLFTVNGNWMRVLNGKVVVWLQQGIIVNGKVRDFVQCDLVTGNPISYWDFSGSSSLLTNYDLNDNVLRINNFDLTAIPTDQLSLVNGYSNKNSIYYWSQTSDGFIVGDLSLIHI